jgi:hypothetical protein
MERTDVDAPLSSTTEEDLLAIKAEYLAAHSSYQTYLALCATAELGNSRSWNELLAELELARNNLDRARNAYRDALFEIAFDSD